ncbi:MAG: CsgG/HfaB family protein [Thermodesulfobacteriota bacterium]
MQMRNSGKIAAALAALLACAFLFSCASTSAVDDGPKLAAQTAAPVAFPPFTGEKTPLAVLPMGLSKIAAERYPQLLQRSVGMGVHNVLTETLYETGRFRLVEADESVIEKVFKQQWLSASGAVDESTAVQLGKVLGAKKVIYGEVYDYSEGKTEKTTGLSTRTTPRIRVGIQVRLTDVETLEYVPGSGTATGTDWSEASQGAIRAAVANLLPKLPN